MEIKKGGIICDASSHSTKHNLAAVVEQENLITCSVGNTGSTQGRGEIQHSHRWIQFITFVAATGGHGL